MKRDKVFAEPPLEKEKVYFSNPKTVAGGIPALISTMKQSIGKMGAVKAIKTLAHMNQKHGFDCPGCAWPEPDEERSKFEFCENGAKAIAEEAMTKKITSAFWQKWSIGALSQQSDYWLGQEGRLTEPVFLPENSSHYEPISWEKAFDILAEKLKKLESPHEACFYTSGRTSNEAAFLLQLFVRLFGTNNLPDCSNMCHESSGTGLKEVIGVGKGTVTLEDFEHADCIIIMGQNPGTNHPRMLTTLQKSVRKGTRIIVINPILETGNNHFIHPQEVTTLFGKGTPMQNLFLPVKINGDVALLKGIMKEILDRDKKSDNTIIDHQFIKEFTAGFADFLAEMQNVSWEDVCKGSGICREDIVKAAEMIIASKNVICCWAMGITQHVNGVANVQEIVNLLLLGGNIGRKGAGVCPVRGHSNVQGDRTMGIMSKPSKNFNLRLEKKFGFAPPEEKGFDTLEAIEAMMNKKVKVFFAMGGNFLSATPDTNYTAAALQKCDMTVHVSTKLNRSHLITGKEALILPCLGRTEEDNTGGKKQFVTVENSMGIVHSSMGKNTPASPQLKSEIEIIVQIATRVFTKSKKENIVTWEKMYDYHLVREAISKVVPGFDNYNEKVKAPQGFYLPNAVRDERKFATSSAKANFTVHPIPDNKIPENSYYMMTIRSHDQYNTTIYGNQDRYRGILSGRRIILMNPDDITKAGFQESQKVDIISTYNSKERIAKSFVIVPYQIPRECVATYFPEANVLIPIEHKAEKSNTPASKSIIVRLCRHTLI